jgi:hypothetical protein
MSKKLTAKQQQTALDAVAKWMGKKGYGTITPCGTCESCKAGLKYDWQCDEPEIGPAPTGEEAAHSGEGPVLNPSWDWPSSGPTPTIILEGGPEEWALEVTWDPEVREALDKAGIFAEPYASWALCLYPA